MYSLPAVVTCQQQLAVIRSLTLTAIETFPVIRSLTQRIPVVMTAILTAFQPFRVILEKLQITMPDHCGAGSGWDDNIAGSLFEDADGVLGEGAGIPAQAGVEGGLSAASLTGREADLHAQTA